MNSQNTLTRFGENVPGYEVPVLNEREIRASAGILFVLMFMSLVFILFKEDFLLIKYFIILFLTDLMVRVFINPKFSPLLIIGRLIVSRQAPEYVAAAPKKFAWKIGIGLAGMMFFLLDIVNSYSIITGMSCIICLVFLFFESSFGICLGCMIYGWFYKDKVQLCPGEICTERKKEDIQKTSGTQVLVLLGLVAYIVLLVVLLKDHFSTNPRNLWAIARTIWNG
ncbi:MAG TPA: DUF4395 domain-containing protein [Chitinophagaceae bacterium]|nr:DUF4395 domain-containing protein [Chitinophagaceae bacterium]